MKVLFIWNGLTHYFNLITSKINSQPGVEVTYVYPKVKSTEIGDGVFQTKGGVNFQLIELEEKVNDENGTLYFDGLEIVLREWKPDIILLSEIHIQSIMFESNLKKIIEEQNINIVLKSIPFQLEKYEQRVDQIKSKIKRLPLPPFESMPSVIRKILKALSVDLLYKKLVLDKKAFRQNVKELNLQKDIFNFPDAHVNYIEEAYDIYGSYDVPREKIFITYNSPDTDFYFSVKAKIEKEPSILPVNKFRIIHLSRLIKWKRVDMLVTAVANLKSEFPEIELLVVGEGPEKGNLIEHAKLLDVVESIEFLGGVYDPELLGKYIMASSIYVLAGMGGLSINDAMIFGLPVICSICDGTEKYLVKEGYNGLYFENGTQGSLEDKIRYLFNNPELCHQMGNNSVSIIKEKINIHTVVNGYMKAFNYVLNN